MKMCSKSFGVTVAAAMLSVAWAGCSAALAQITVTGVGPLRWGQTDGSVGLVGATVESFESVNLAPGLRVRWSAPGGVVGPVSVLPATFNPATDDPIGSAFADAAWDGVRGLVSSRGNVVTTYSNSTGNWGDLELLFDPPVAAVGFSLQNMQGSAGLIVNGVNLGTVPTLSGLSLSGSRNGYVLIQSASATISSVLLDNSGGDGFCLDRVLFTTRPAPVVTVSGLDASVWPRPDATLGLNIAAVEDFEDTLLTPGLAVGWDTPAVGGLVPPASELPRTFAPVTDDPFGNAFDQGPWDGTRVVVNTRTNASFAYSGTQEWGDVVFRFDPPRQAVGFSIQQANGPVRLLINGRDVGELLSRAGFSPSGARHGYARIVAPCDGELISELRLNNNRAGGSGDGFVVDHMILGSTVGVLGQPQSRPVCLLGSATLSIVPGGTPPFSFVWQWREVGEPAFRPVLVGANTGPSGPGARFSTAAVDEAALQIVGVTDGPPLEFRCALASGCGTALSAPAIVHVACPNPADIAQDDGSPGCDGSVNNGDFQLFFSQFFSALCPGCGAEPPPPGPCNPADLAAADGTPGADGCVNNGDFQLFFASFFAQCP